MKKFLYIVALVAAMISAACSKSDDLAQQEGKGAVSFMFPVTRVAVPESTYQMMKFRIYSHDANSGEKTLVRLYTYDEIKEMKMWLVAGKYSIAVEGGVKSPASFTDIYYQGSTEFDLAAGEEKTVTVEAHPKNTMIKVVFDESISQKMEGAKAVIAIDDAFRVEKIISGEVAHLTYEQTAVGFFMIEEDQPSFAWNFSGKVPSKDNAEVEKVGVYTPEEGFKEGAMYTITFKYSDDLGGYITMDIAVDETIKEYDDLLVFKPEPQITGPALGEEKRVYAGMDALTYDVKAIAELTTIKVTVGDNVYTYTTVDGETSNNSGYFSVAQVAEGSNLNWNVTLGDQLLTSVAAGRQKVIISATDVEGVEGEVEAMFFGEGTFAMETIDAWTTTAKLKAYVNDAAAQGVKIYFRESGAQEWSSADATLVTDNVYEAVVTGVDGGRTYEYYLKYADAQKGVNATFKTSGVQIPNGNMETWRSVSSKNMLIPYIPTISSSNFKDYAGKSTTWDTGNHGAATLGGNVTVNSNVVREGTTGTTSALLQSQFVGVAGLGKFAAGNLFYGTYVTTSGTNGTIGFGQPFTFDYRPKKLVVWYKGRVGTIDELGKGGDIGLSSGSSDKAVIYVWLCNWSGQHKVNTADSSTFVNPETTATTAEGNVLGYGVWNRVISGSDSGADNGWQKIEIPITYREGEGFTGVKPNFLVISCAASGYGDYFAGSTDSYMYVDDFEFVY